MANYSPYDVLGVPHDADDAAIRAAYRRAARSAHPDAGGTSAQFVTVRQAYELLCEHGHRTREGGDVDERVPPCSHEPAPQTYAPGDPAWLGARRYLGRAALVVGTIGALLLAFGPVALAITVGGGLVAAAIGGTVWWSWDRVAFTRAVETMRDRLPDLD